MTDHSAAAADSELQAAQKLRQEGYLLLSKGEPTDRVYWILDLADIPESVELPHPLTSTQLLQAVQELVPEG